MSVVHRVDETAAVASFRAGNVAIEIAEYPKRERQRLTLRLLQFRLGNRMLWTWSWLTADVAREIGRELIAAADRMEARHGR